MTTNFVMPRIDVPIGRTVGELVYFDANFLRSFLQKLSDRIGGDVALSNKELADIADQINADALDQRSDPIAQEALRAVDELRNEVASIRSAFDELRGLLGEHEARIAGIRTTSDMRSRLEQLEDRFP